MRTDLDETSALVLKSHAAAAPQAHEALVRAKKFREISPDSWRNLREINERNVPSLGTKSAPPPSVTVVGFPFTPRHATRLPRRGALQPCDDGLNPDCRETLSARKRCAHCRSARASVRLSSRLVPRQPLPPVCSASPLLPHLSPFVQELVSEKVRLTRTHYRCLH